MQLSDLIGKLNVAKVVGNDCIEITSVEADSRRVAEGSLFVAVRGVSVDGHTFIAKAEAQGASAVVCEELPDELSPRVTYVVTPESREALGLLASAWYGEPSRQLTLVGVTGTNGKTTIATLLYEMFRFFGEKVGLLSTVCNYVDDRAVPTDHTTPDPLTLHRLLREMVDAGCRYAFMEVSSHSVDQRRIAGLEFAGGIFTNLTRDHLDYHKTVQAYLKAKKRFFDDLPEDAFALTNADEKNGTVMLQNTRAEKHTYALNTLADYKGRIIESRLDRKSMGFGAELKSKNDVDESKILREVQPHDILKFGIIPELVGRLPVITALDALTRDDLVKILTQPKNALVKQYQKLFSYDDAELTFEPKALEAIADKAIERKIGARGLRAVMEGLLMNVMYDIPSDRTIDRVTITPGCVEGTEQPKISHRTEKEGEAPQPSLPADSAS